MKPYLIVDKDGPLRRDHTHRVMANTPEHAVERYIGEVYSKDQHFRDDVLDLSVNCSFAERFYLKSDQEQARFSSTGTFGTEEEVVLSRVKQFFAKRPDLGAKYLAYMDSENPSGFDDEFFSFVALQLPLDELAFDAFEIDAIPLIV
jgi:hypothetical protein